MNSKLSKGRLLEGSVHSHRIDVSTVIGEPLREKQVLLILRLGFPSGSGG